MLKLSLSNVCLCENSIFQEKYKARVLIIDNWCACVRIKAREEEDTRVHTQVNMPRESVDVRRFEAKVCFSNWNLPQLTIREHSREVTN